MGTGLRTLAPIAGLLSALVGLSCSSGAPFSCQTSDQCGVGGLCQAEGYCSFEDLSCTSGQAYGTLAPPALAGQCVSDPIEPATGDGDAGGEGTTATPVQDPSTSDGIDPDGDDTLALTSGGSSSVDDDGETGGSDGIETATDDGASSTGAPPIQRVTDGQLVLYRFDQGSGDEIEDLSGVEPPVPLTIVSEDESPSWGGDGLHFDGAGIAVAMGSSSKVRLGVQATGTLTVETWCTPDEQIQTGPPRLVTLSQDSTNRSFSLVHGGIAPNEGSLPVGDQYGMRVATDVTGFNGVPTLLTPSVAELQPTHVAATRDADQMVTIYVDGEALVSELREGSLADWGIDHAVAVGNEVTLGRPYRGTIHLAAVYDRALSPDEIVQNRDAGF